MTKRISVDLTDKEYALYMARKTGSHRDHLLWGTGYLKTTVAGDVVWKPRPANVPRQGGKSGNTQIAADVGDLHPALQKLLDKEAADEAAKPTVDELVAERVAMEVKLTKYGIDTHGLEERYGQARIVAYDAMEMVGIWPLRAYEEYTAAVDLLQEPKTVQDVIARKKAKEAGLVIPERPRRMGDKGPSPMDTYGQYRNKK